MEVSTYAIIEAGVVTNIVLWDGSADWVPPEGATAIDIGAISTPVSIGYLWSNGAFSAPVKAD